MEPILEIRQLNSFYRQGGSAFSRGRTVQVLQDINVTIGRGEVLGLVGESGSGKSTLAKSILGMTEYQGEIVHHSRRPQMVFQDPYSSLNPRMSIGEIIGEPLRIHAKAQSRAELDKEVSRLMDVVGLSARLFNAYPHELDGGRRQRIGIARALALQPEFIVCDEPVSALDVSIQAQILNLMQDVQEERKLAYLFITHDLSVVHHMANRIMVMYLGQMVELCSGDDLFEHQYHPYTQALLSAIPTPTLHQKKRILLKGEITSPIDPPEGCRFARRCPYADEHCKNVTPEWREVSPGHFAACNKAESM